MNIELQDIDLKLRSLTDNVKSGAIKADEARKQFDELRALKIDAEKRSAMTAAPLETRSVATYADMKNAMIEKRAITMNGNGAINQVNEIVKIISEKTPLLQGVKYFNGPNATTNIPLLSPGLAAPATSSEGATTGSTDSTAVLTKVTITPTAYVSTLPVSWEALNLNSANLESQFPELFADVYAAAMHKLVVDKLFATGGVDSGNKTDCAAAGLPTVIDLAKLAIKMADYADEGVLVMSPTTYNAIVGSATNEVGKIYTEGLIRDKMIEGVKVIITGKAPSAITDGSALVVGGNLANVGVGVASSMMVTPKTKVGDTNTYYDVAMYFGADVIQPANFFSLVAYVS